MRIHYGMSAKVALQFTSKNVGRCGGSPCGSGDGVVVVIVFVKESAAGPLCISTAVPVKSAMPTSAEETKIV